MSSERLSAEPLPLSRPDSEHYQRHPIPGQQRLDLDTPTCNAYGFAGGQFLHAASIGPCPAHPDAELEDC